jgi:sucrose-6-phosphate hydrolase SacC (GH32 family)
VDALETLREPKPVAERAFLGEVWRSDLKTGQTHKVIAENLDAFDVELVLKLESIANAAKPTVTFSLHGTELLYDVTKKTLTCKGVSAPVPLKDGNLALRILVDRGSVEVFADSGRVAMSIAAIPAEKNTRLELTATGMDIFVDTLKVYAMQSSWGR